MEEISEVKYMIFLDNIGEYYKGFEDCKLTGRKLVTSTVALTEAKIYKSMSGTTEAVNWLCNHSDLRPQLMTVTETRRIEVTAVSEVVTPTQRELARQEKAEEQNKALQAKAIEAWNKQQGIS